MTLERTSDGKFVVVECVVAHSQFDEGRFNFGDNYSDGSLDLVIQSLLDIKNSIPEEYRASARCSIDSEGGYEGSHYATIEVTYVRPATDEEIEVYHRQQALRQAEQEAKERRELERLIVKFGKP